MSSSIDDVIGSRLKSLREAAGMSLGALSRHAGVSKTMIARVERAESSATAALLGRLCAALGVTMSSVVAEADQPGERVLRAEDQSVWTDPESGYVRRHASPPTTASGIELVVIDLPPNQRVAYEGWQNNVYTQQLLMLKGQLTLTIAGRKHDLAEGDSVDFDVSSANVYETDSHAARYVLAKRRCDRRIDERR
jgi:transcriptional regulator with XRE-family HTH domain